MIYLDNNATTFIDDEVLECYQSILMDRTVGNPHSSEHSWGWKANRIVQDAAEYIAQEYGFFGSDLIFTSGATEANNLAILGLAQSALLQEIPRRRILVSQIEHKCVLNSAQFAMDILGFSLEVIPVHSSGVVNLGALESLLDEDVLLVSVMAVNNEIGTIQPLSEIGRLVEKVGAIFHSDMAQGGYLEVDAYEMGIDLISLSAHKIYGPKGIGALLIDRANMALPLEPTLHGGGQQDGLRAGTLSPAACGAFAKALERMALLREKESETFIYWRELFISELKQAEISFTVNGHFLKRHPGNLNLSLHGLDSRLLITRLADRVALSSGSACNSGIIERSYVLQALNLRESEIESALRLCFGRHNTIEEVKQAAGLVIQEAQYLLQNRL